MIPPPLLALDGVSCGYGKRVVLSNVGFAVEAGEFLCLVGPNGSGKTTLFKTILRLLPLQGGSIRIDGENVDTWPARRFAATVGYVPQAHTAPFPFTVLDVAAMGRAAHLDVFASPSAKDTAIAEEALEILSIRHLRHERYTEISGGERQLVLIARALAQRPKLLILDEPTSNLDYGNQIRVLDHIQALIRRGGLGVIMTTHDPNNALSYGSRVAAIDRQGVVRLGSPGSVITEEYLLSTYAVRTEIARVTVSGGGERRVCLPLGKTAIVVQTTEIDASTYGERREG